MSQNLDKNTESEIKEQPKPSPTIPELYAKLIENPKMQLFWGEVGVGKSSLALQLSRNSLISNQKVFFLSTKQSSINILIQRIFGSLSSEFNDNFYFWQATNLKNQQEIVVNWIHLIKQIQNLRKSEKIAKVGLIIIDDIASLYLLEQAANPKEEIANRTLTFILATLSRISLQFKIPILLLMQFLGLA